MTDAIELVGVRWEAGGREVLRDLTLRVPEGSIYGFLGPNGAGKTTAIRILLGMLKPDRGSISVLGMEVPREMPRILARVGYVPERPHVYPALTVGEQLRHHAAFRPAWAEGWARALVERLCLDPGLRISRLSKGETGKLLVLLALAPRPDVLVMDEPTDGLDPVVRRDVLGAVLDYVGETGATVLVSSHLVHELERICDWVGVLDDGAMVDELPMEEFRSGIKRIRVEGVAAEPVDPPFTLLGRERANGRTGSETWTVRGWREPMLAYFAAVGASVRNVVDLDLEEGFVELLRSSRRERTSERTAEA